MGDGRWEVSPFCRFPKIEYHRPSSTITESSSSSSSQHLIIVHSTDYELAHWDLLGGRFPFSVVVVVLEEGDNRAAGQQTHGSLVLCTQKDMKIPM